MRDVPVISLLFPQNHKRPATVNLNQTAINDLSLRRTVEAFTADRTLRRDIEEILFALTIEPDIIRYRQAVLADFMGSAELVETFEQLLPQISALTVYRHSIDRQRVPLQELAWRISELDYLVSCVSVLSQTFQTMGSQIRSAGLLSLRDAITLFEEDPTYQQLVEELPILLPKMRANLSVTIGVNLDRELRPVEAVLIDVNEEAYTASPLLQRLLGRQGEMEGIGQLHRAPLNLYGDRGGTRRSSEYGGVRGDPLMGPLFRDLTEVLKKVVGPVEKSLKKYLNLNGHFLDRLRGEIGFFLSAARLAERLRGQGLPLCMPEIAPLADAVSHVRDGYNLNLARHLMAEHPGLSIKEKVILNDVTLGRVGQEGSGQIAILTGPNQGGKTTYTQMIGIIQMMAQAGLFVPAAAATISPIDQIYTHYPIEEQLEKGTGRFGDEARRLNEIFQAVTGNSLVLLNEALSGTGPGEAIYLARDVVRILGMLGTRTIFNTHLHGLAEEIGEINREFGGKERVQSLVASPIIDGEDDPEKRSYRIIAGPPLGRSYAREIASKYGISYAQLQAQLRERGLL